LRPTDESANAPMPRCRTPLPSKGKQRTWSYHRANNSKQLCLCLRCLSFSGSWKGTREVDQTASLQRFNQCMSSRRLVYHQRNGKVRVYVCEGSRICPSSVQSPRPSSARAGSLDLLSPEFQLNIKVGSSSFIVAVVANGLCKLCQPTRVKSSPHRRLVVVDVHNDACPFYSRPIVRRPHVQTFAFKF